MNLSEATRIVHPDACFICKWAGHPVTVFPLAGYADATVDVFAKVREGLAASVLGLRSGKRKINACPAHYSDLQEDYIIIMAEEMAFDRAWNDYIDRVET